MSDPKNIENEVCTSCGYANCERKRFLASNPLWVGDDCYYYSEICLPSCNKAANTLGERYAELWKPARQSVIAGYYFMGEASAEAALKDWLLANVTKDDE